MEKRVESHRESSSEISSPSIGWTLASRAKKTAIASEEGDRDFHESGSRFFESDTRAICSCSLEDIDISEVDIAHARRLAINSQCVAGDRSRSDHKDDCNDRARAEVFKDYFVNEADIWFDNLDIRVQQSYKLLRAAFLEHFDWKLKPADTYRALFDHLRSCSIATVSRSGTWRLWLRRLEQYALGVPHGMASDQSIALSAWALIPGRLKRLIPRPMFGVKQFVAFCWWIPQKALDQVVAEYERQAGRVVRDSDSKSNAESAEWAGGVLRQAVMSNNNAGKKRAAGTGGRIKPHAVIEKNKVYTMTRKKSGIVSPSAKKLRKN